MKRIELVCTLCLMGAIFAAGVLTGRWTAPREPGPASAFRLVVDSNLARFAGMVPMTLEELDDFRPAFERFARELTRFDPGTPERLKAFRDGLPELRTAVPEEHRAEFDRYGEITGRQIERRIARREGREIRNESGDD